MSTTINAERRYVIGWYNTLNPERNGECAQACMTKGEAEDTSKQLNKDLPEMHHFAKVKEMEQ